MLRFTEEEMRQKLCQDELDLLSNSEVYSILYDGCTGWRNFSEEDIIQYMEDVFDFHYEGKDGDSKDGDSYLFSEE